MPYKYKVRKRQGLMDIKALKPHSQSESLKYSQGYYTPVNKEKYCGGYPIIYRSSWELRVCKLLDLSPEVKRWGSECISVKYFSSLDQKYHEYFPDFYFERTDNDGNTKHYVLEVKPKKYLTKPEQPKRVTEKSLKRFKYEAETFVRNTEKARACEMFCKQRGWEYKFVTEDSRIPIL